MEAIIKYKCQLAKINLYIALRYGCDVCVPHDCACITLIPWSNGRFSTWDATCIDTLAPSYIDISSAAGGKISEKAAVKRHRYKLLTETENHIFVPFAVESMGPICMEGKKLFNDIGKKITDILKF